MEKKLRMDSVRIRTILPENIWRQIVDEIEDPVDLESLNNSSSYFRHFLHSRKVLFLFPKVFQILVENHAEDSSKQDESTKEQNYNTNTGKIPIEYLHLRSVCRQWKHAIEIYYHQQLFRHIRRGNIYQWISHLYYVEDVHQYGEHFVTTTGPSNGKIIHVPFYSRTISVTLYENHGRECDEGKQFLMELTSVLQTYGHHIWNVSIIFKDAHHWCIFYSWMLTLLSLMPNLKTIRIDREYCDGWVDNVAGLLSMINYYPIPTFENLHFLSFRGLTEEIAEELLRKNSHIPSLNLGHNQYNRFLPTVPLSNLVDLSMKIKGSEDIGMLQCPQVKWKVSKLYICISDTFIDFCDLFNTLENKWAATLTRLKIDFAPLSSMIDRLRIRSLCASLRLNLWRLNHLSLNLSHFTSMDFILPMPPSLESLSLYFSCSYDEIGYDTLLALEWESRGMIKLLSGLDRIYNSNVWVLLPKLRQIYCKFDTSVGGKESFVHTRQNVYNNLHL